MTGPSPDLLQVVARLAVLLQEMGHPDRAAWLQQRSAILGNPSANAEERDSVRGELHGVVVGMGGLFDLQPKANPLAPTSRSAKKELDALADRLYRLTG